MHLCIRSLALSYSGQSDHGQAFHSESLDVTILLSTNNLMGEVFVLSLNSKLYAVSRMRALYDLPPQTHLESSLKSLL